MTPKTRHILFIVFIILFLTISPLMVIYAFGFKFNLEKMSFQKTGILVINTKPKGAKIYIDGKPKINPFKFYNSKDRFTKTPAKIKNIIPKRHNIKLELAGCWKWEKNLTINPGETVYIEDVRLFKKDLPALLFSQEKNSLQAIKIAPDKTKIAMINNQKLTIFDLDKEEKIAQIKIPKFKKYKILWSKNNEKIIINNIIFEIKTKKIIDLEKTIKAKPNNLKWSNNNTGIFYQNNSGIYSFNLLTKKSTRICTAKIDDYLIKNNKLFYLATNSQNTVLNIYDLENNKNVGEIKLISANYKFINPNNKWINIYNIDNQKLYLLELMHSWDNKYNQKILKNIKINVWAGDQIFYTNNFEINIWDSRNNSFTILTRVSDKILNIIWHPSNNYIIYQTKQKINTLELDKREKHNINTLIKVNNINYSTLNQSGDILYFYADIGNQSGLYKLKI